MRGQRSILLFSAATLALFAAAPAAAQPVEVTRHYCDFKEGDFSAGPGHIELNGDAAFGAGELVLTPDQTKKTGTAFYNEPLKLDDMHELHVYFKAQIQPDPAGEKGMSFMIQNNSSSSVGANLDGLGFGGIMPSVIFEIDTSLDPEPPPPQYAPPYIGMVLDGNQSVHSSVVSKMAQGSTQLVTPAFLHMWFDYDATQHFRVYIANDSKKPAEPLAWDVLDGVPPDALDLGALLIKDGVQQGYVGFTAATGQDKSNAHDVLEWELSNEGVPCACQGDSACTGLQATPVCSLVQAQKEGGAVLCVECTSENKDACTPDKPVCHSELEQCVECETDTDCAAGAPVCDPVSHTCGGCTTDADCAPYPETPYCETQGPNQGKCEPCLEHGHCAVTTPICDETTEPIYDCRLCATDQECAERDPNTPTCILTGDQIGQCCGGADCPPLACEGQPCDCATGECCSASELESCPDCEDRACDCATGACCDQGDLDLCKKAEIVGGGCGCSTPGGSRTTTAALGLGALAALLALGRRRRRG